MKRKLLLDNKPVLPSLPLVSQKFADDTDFAVPDLLDLACLKQTIIASKITNVIVPENQYIVGKTEREGTEIQAVRLDVDGKVVDQGQLQVLHFCDVCPYKHVSKEMVIQHEARHVKLNPNVKDDLKPSTNITDTESMASDDDTIADDEDSEVLVCHCCDYHTMNKIDLKEHMLVHSLQYKNGNFSFTKDGSIEECHARISLKALQECLDRKKLDSNTEYYIKKGEDQTLNRSHMKKWCCDRCAYNTDNELFYERHLDLHGSQQTFSCQWCDYSIPHLRYLNAHTKLHMQPNPNLLTLQSITNLQHLTEVSADVALVTNFPDCVQKDDPVSHTVKQNDHQLWEHCAEFMEPKRMFLCERCPFISYTRGELSSHLSGHINNSLTAVKCRYCDYKVSPSNIELLDEHQTIHFSTTNGNVKIELEDADSNNNKTGSKKLQTDTDEESEGTVCKYCDRRFKSAEQKMIHQQLHLMGSTY